MLRNYNSQSRFQIPVCFFLFTYVQRHFFCLMFWLICKTCIPKALLSQYEKKWFQSKNIFYLQITCKMLIIRRKWIGQSITISIIFTFSIFSCYHWKRQLRTRSLFSSCAEQGISVTHRRILMHGLGCIIANSGRAGFCSIQSDLAGVANIKSIHVSFNQPSGMKLFANLHSMVEWSCLINDPWKGNCFVYLLCVGISD